jgi:hypothetical protein
MKIGDFEIKETGNDGDPQKVAIHRGDGEGAEFDKALFEKAIEQFYNEHF